MENITTKMMGLYLNAMAMVSPETAGRHGFNIFCYPIRTPVKTHHQAFFDSSEKFRFIVDGAQVQGYKWGNGPKKILFLHGWKSHSFYWKNYIQALPEQEFTLFAIDAPGHGLSPGRFLNVPYYSHVISHAVNLVGEPDSIISHSLGSFSILHLLHSKPMTSLKKLVLLAPPGKASDFFNYYKTVLNLSDRTVRSTLNHFEKEIQKPIDYFSTINFAHKLNTPGLIIHDKDDKETPYENAVNIHKVWKNSQLVTTNGLSHNLKSSELVHTVKDFIMEPKFVSESSSKG